MQHGAAADAPLGVVELIVAVGGRVMRTTTNARVIDVGVAFDTPDGIAVPVIRDPDRMQLPELARAIHELAQAAGDGRLHRRPLATAHLTVAHMDTYVAALVPPLPPVIEVGGLETIAVFRGGVFEPRRVLPLRMRWDGGMGEGEAERLCRRVAALVGDPLRLLFRSGA